ncbi:unnamed protein product, partial [Heterosigma akashiwo]
MQEYLDVLTQSKNQLVVMKFYAPWCRSCKALDVKFRKWARGEYAARDVRFFECDVFDPQNA